MFELHTSFSSGFLINIAYWAYNRNQHSFWGKQKETQACAITLRSMVYA